MLGFARSLLFVVVISSGCGDDGAGGDAAIDATVDGAGDGALAAPALPAPPEWPCSDGWVEVTVAEGATACHPFADVVPEDAVCPVGQLRAPGDDACAPVSAGCTGRFPTDLPGGPVTYVDIAAAPGGDGSMDAPYQNLSGVIDLASAGDVIAVAAGRYDATVTLRREVTIVGACADEVVIGASIAGPGVNAAGGASELRQVTIDSGGYGVLVQGAATRLTLAGVIVRDALGAGIIASEGTLVAHDTVIEGTRMSSRLEGGGRGLNLQAGATAEIRRVALVDNLAAGIALQERSSMTLTDSLIDGVGPGGPARGIGIQVRDSQLTADRIVVRRTGESSLDVLTMSTAVVSDLVAEDSGAINVRHSYSDLHLSRALLRRHAIAGIAIQGEGTSLELQDTLIVETAQGPDGTTGRAVDLDESTVARLNRVVISGAHEIGMGSFGADLFATDILLQDVRTSVGGGRFGRGINVQRGTVSMERVLIRDVREFGVVLVDCSVEVSDLTIEGVDDDALEQYGHGVQLEHLEGAVLNRVAVSDAHGAGVVALGAAANISDLRVSGTAPTGCVIMGCVAAAGVGVLVDQTASLDVQSFEIVDNELAGFQLMTADLDLSNGTVAGHPIGIAVAVDDYDLSRLSNRVTFSDNEINLDARSLPVPAPSQEL